MPNMTKTLIAVPFAALAIAACGGSSHRPAEPRTTTVASSSPTAIAKAQNDRVMQQAAQAGDNQAQLGADKIQRILTQKINMNSTLEFNLNGTRPAAEEGDCYVKLGADAVNFENQPENILRGANGKDVVFVQSNTATPLVNCLSTVRTALNW